MLADNDKSAEKNVTFDHILPVLSIQPTQGNRRSTTKDRITHLLQNILANISENTTIIVVFSWWVGKDSNLGRRMPADLQSAPFDRFGTHPWSRRPGLNR